VLSSFCVPRITSQIRQKPRDNTNTQLLHNDLTSKKLLKNIGLIPEAVKRPGREANHFYPVPTSKSSGALPLYCRYIYLFIYLADCTMFPHLPAPIKQFDNYIIFFLQLFLSFQSSSINPFSPISPLIPSAQVSLGLAASVV
jgi:hypothetical protein